MIGQQGVQVATDASKQAVEALNGVQGLSPLRRLIPVIGLILQAANLILTLGILFTLPQRIDAIENITDSLSKDLSRVFGLLNLYVRRSELSGLKGLRGERGEKGIKGDRGIQGLTGKDGKPGIKPIRNSQFAIRNYVL